MNKLPLARHTDIVIQELGKEVLVYDLNTHKIYNLNETASVVYRACDGETAFDELRMRTNFSDEIIFLALDELKETKLLENDKPFVSPFVGLSRREAIRRVGLASAVALPVIASLMAPRAADAQSSGGGSCSPDGTVVDISPQTGASCFPAAITSSTTRCCSGPYQSATFNPPNSCTYVCG